MKIEPSHIIPADGLAGCLIGRVWVDGRAPGPRPVWLGNRGVIDLSALAPTVSDLLELPDIAARVRASRGEVLGTVEECLRISLTSPGRHLSLLAPCDLQAIKAAGVTFVDSLIERVIEERAKGDSSRAAATRRELQSELGLNLSSIRPGSEDAERVKCLLVERGLWSQYLEVGLGADAEIFTKAQPLSAVGVGAEIGLHPASRWNNPEPEVVLACNSQGTVVGATLGNDVNLRDFEGRSALLLSRAKDNNASCAIGPFIRVFDATFGLGDMRTATLELTVAGPDGYRLQAASVMSRISRDPLDLVEQTFGSTHQYPDGAMLFLGTMFCPTEDRDQPGQGFTHKVGDIVSIRSPKLGTLVNTVTSSDRAAPWTFGFRALQRSLVARRCVTIDTGADS